MAGNLNVNQPGQSNIGQGAGLINYGGTSNNTSWPVLNPIPLSFKMHKNAKNFGQGGNYIIMFWPNANFLL